MLNSMSENSKLLTVHCRSLIDVCDTYNRDSEFQQRHIFWLTESFMDGNNGFSDVD